MVPCRNARPNYWLILRATGSFTHEPSREILPGDFTFSSESSEAANFFVKISIALLAAKAANPDHA
jgi:hypothetical protein